MRRISELTRNGKLIEALRWLCVLPAAVLGDSAVQFIVGAAAQIVGLGGSRSLSDSGIAYLLTLFLYYVPRKAVFVVAGATMAPRRRIATAIVLAVLGISLSLVIHVLGQHFAGNRVGLVNYTHFSLESAGILGGAAFIVFWDWSNRST